MADGRPDPEEILRRVQAEERRASRGKLTVFFGAAPGVGKTYAMLEAAAEEKAEGTDVVVGLVETHGRAETKALLSGQEVLPRRTLVYRGVTLQEFDLDGALNRHPRLLLIDELAHTNADGSRHPKRWQDVAELLNAGINVFTTLNVQHIESLSEVIAVGMGLMVRETVPDEALDLADEIRLIDLPPDELLERLAQGRVYVPEQVGPARENFFRKENLDALRELALRQTAERVGALAKRYQKDKGLKRTWTVAERLLVCVSEGPLAEKVLWAGSRIVMRLHVPWAVLHVETPGNVSLREARREALGRVLQKAEQLGAEVITVSGTDVAHEILRFAREWGATRIVVGQPRRTWFPFPPWRTVLDRLLSETSDQDVWVARLTRAAATRGPKLELALAKQRSSPRHYVAAVLAIVAATAVGLFFFGRSRPADVVMLYLLGVVLVSMRYGYGPSLLASAVSVMGFDFFFIPPYFTFAVADVGHIITFAILLVVGLVISNLTERIRAQAEAARAREKRIGVQYALSRVLARASGQGEIVAAARKQIEEVFESRTYIFLADPESRLVIQGQDPADSLPTEESGVVDWVWQNNREAGQSTDTLPGSRGLYLPLTGSRGILGVVGIVPGQPGRFRDPEQRRLLDSFTSLTAIALERARMAEESQRAKADLEQEGLRNTLLASVSHDLRTPIALITGAASALADETGRMDATTRRDLAKSVYDGARRLARQVRDLLDMTRLQSGTIHLKRDWHSVEEIVGSALNQLEELLAGRPVEVKLAPDLQLLCVDESLVEKLLVNLLENALKYSPRGEPIEIRSERRDAEVVLMVGDRGPGIPDEDKRRIFDKFYRGDRPEAREGAGLGLAICRAIVEAHGGRVWVENRPSGGSLFCCALPMGGEPPPLELPPAELQEDR